MHAAAPRRDRLHGGPGHAVDAYEVEPLRQVFALRGRYRLSPLRATCAPIETPARAARLSHCRLSCVDAVDRPLWWATRRWPTKTLATENGAITGWPGRDRRRLIARIRWHDRIAENYGSTVAQWARSQRQLRPSPAGWVGSRSGCEKMASKRNMAAALVDAVGARRALCGLQCVVAWSAFARHAHLLIFSFVLTVLPPHSSPNNCSAGP